MSEYSVQYGSDFWGGINMKKVLIQIIIILFIVPVGVYANKPFGIDGLKGLTVKQKQRLAKGGIIFYTGKNKDGRELILAAIVFNNSLEKTWKLLAKSENQVKYLDDLKETRLVFEKEKKNCVYFMVKVGIIKKEYQVIHWFNKSNNHIHWSLDPNYKNDLAQVRGYWRLYNYGN